ncbi:WXG100 family type VII secretion target [Actinoplanes sp. NPDC000266]
MAGNVSPEKFRVMMDVFGSSINVVEAQRRRVEAALDGIRAGFRDAEQDWKSPAAQTFGELTREFDADAATLEELLGEILSRMRQSFENYREVELQNTRNLQHSDANESGPTKTAAPEPTATATATLRSGMISDGKVAGLRDRMAAG